jgi:heme ABC exporter ATP-binding subunit CcmA
MDLIVDFQNAVFIAGNFPVLTGVDMSVHSGEIVHLQGANGAGKTSLLRAIVGLIPIRSGKAIVLGHDLAQDRFSVREEVALLGHKTFLYDDLSIYENLRFLQRVFRRPKQVVELAMAQVGISAKLAKAKVSHLSAGQRKRTSLAALLIKDAALWLLDEPHAGVDEAGRALIDGLISDFASRGGTVLMASHELDRAIVVSDKSFIISGGVVTGEEIYTTIKHTASMTTMHERDFDLNSVPVMDTRTTDSKMILEDMTTTNETGHVDVA